MPAMRRPLHQRDERCVVPFAEGCFVRASTGERVCGVTPADHDRLGLVHRPAYAHDTFVLLPPEAPGP